MTTFDDLDRYVALPRVSGLTLAPDGSRLVTAVATLNPEKTRYVTALWEVDPSGERPARRLTRSAKGEGAASFLPDGGLLFVSARPDPDAAKDDDPPAALWLLPDTGGEARVVATRPGGIGGFQVARESGHVVLSSSTFASSVTAADDEKVRKDRKDGKVTAILHEGYPVRYWDHDLGPDRPRLLVGTVAAEDLLAQPSEDETRPGRMELRDLTPDPGGALTNASWEVTPDGATVVTTWQAVEVGGQRETLVAIDVATGTRRTLLDDPRFEYSAPAISPDGSRVAVQVWTRSTANQPPDVAIRVLDLPTGEQATGELADPLRGQGWDRWPNDATWAPDGSAIFVTADDGGRTPIFRIDLATGALTRLTGDHGVYASVLVSPDGSHVYAIRDAMDAAPAPVRLDATAPDQQPTFLPGPVEPLTLPGTARELVATAADGTTIHSWLCLPEGASEQNPAPLLVWIHGGPLGSADGWSWRWNPWLMVARGYAVVQPDFALSTGYGRAFVERGWGRWGLEPYTDLLAAVDATEALPEIDATRTAAMGGSFGGYLANWTAGHTDRFKGIVTHASLWALDQFGPTTDAYDYWRREMTAEMALANSPHRFVDQIRTPLLVIHGDRDYRVPIGEGLRLWAELCERFQGRDEPMPHKFLYFPDENHWVLTPNHAKLWYATVLAFLEHTVLGRPWEVPALLR